MKDQLDRIDLLVKWFDDENKFEAINFGIE